MSRLSAARAAAATPSPTAAILHRFARTASLPLAAEHALDGARRLDVALLMGKIEKQGGSLPFVLPELRALGAQPRVMLIADTAVSGGRILHKGQQVRPEAVIARGMTDRGLELLRSMEQMGIHTVNRPSAVAPARSKISMARIFADAQIPHPKTAVVENAAELRTAAAEIGLPLVVKIPQSSGGAGVMLAKNSDDLERLAQTHAADMPLVAQEFIPEAAGKDYRVLVARGQDGQNRIVTTIERAAAAEGEFRSNISLGGTARRVDTSLGSAEFSLEDRETAVRAADAFGLDVTGVDMINSGRGKLVVEVNPTAGLPDDDVVLPRDEQLAARIANFAVNGATRRL